MAALPAAAHAQFPFPSAPPTITVIGDSVIASGLPFGRTTVTATRADAVTGAPVAVGTFAASAMTFQPFTINTSAPTLLKPTGDCWQKSAWSSALTPDLQTGDKLAFVGTAIFGQPPRTTITVGAPVGSPGPVPVCSALAPWARNAILNPPATAGASVVLNGVAQKFATQVALTATDGAHTTPAVQATPAANGTWSATVQLGTLDNGPVTITPVVTVPDAVTGATAHIAGPKASLTKS
ncbi:hypothetical protein [Solirubrobacter ginsenosidimutans]|nr:hypothetical protein [Solirubrobacter ginsenosidimutans]